MKDKSHEHRFPGDINPKDPTLTLTEYKPGSIDWRKTANIKPVDVMNNLYLAFKEFILGEGNRSLMVVSSGTGLGKSYWLNKALEDTGCEYWKEVPEYMISVFGEEDSNKGAIRGLCYTDDSQMFFNELLKYSGTWIDKDGKEHERIFVLDNEEIFLEDKCLRSYLFHLLSPYPDNRYLIDHVTQTAHPFQGRFIILMNRPLSDFVENDRELAAILEGYAITRDIRMDMGDQVALLEEHFQNVDLHVDNPKWSMEQEATAKDDAMAFILENSTKIRCYSLFNSFIRIVQDILYQPSKIERQRQMGAHYKAIFGDRDIDWRDDARHELGIR